MVYLKRFIGGVKLAKVGYMKELRVFFLTRLVNLHLSDTVFIAKINLWTDHLLLKMLLCNFNESVLIGSVQDSVCIDLILDVVDKEEWKC